MAGKKNDKGKEKAAASEKKSSDKKGAGDGKLKAANSINVRHILVRRSLGVSSTSMSRLRLLAYGE